MKFVSSIFRVSLLEAHHLLMLFSKTFISCLRALMFCIQRKDWCYLQIKLSLYCLVYNYNDYILCDCQRSITAHKTAITYIIIRSH